MFVIPRWVTLIFIFIGLFVAFFYLLTFFERGRKEKKEKLKDYPKVTFVIPAYNAAEYIKKTLQSILNLEYPTENIKIFVVDDGSKDNTSEIVREMMKRSKNIFLFSKKNEGKAAALNYGIKRVKTEFTAVLDADTLLEKDLLKKTFLLFLVENVMAVTSRLVPLNRKGFFARMQVLEYALTSFFRNLLSNIDALPVAPAFTVYRTYFFGKYGGFDVGNLTEDFEIALRINSKGYRILYVMDSYAKTVVPSKFRDLYRQRIRWGYGTIYNLLKYRHMVRFKYGELGAFLLPNFILGIVIAMLLFLILLYNTLIATIDSVRHLLLGWVPSFSITPFKFLVIFSDPRVVLGAIGTAISLIFLYITKKETDEDINLIQYLLYIVSYLILISYFRIVSIIKFFWKKPSW